MHLAFVLPDPAASGSGGGADYVHGLIEALRASGHVAEASSGDAVRFPDGAVPVVDGMALPGLHGRLDELVARRAVALIHHVSAAAGRDPALRERVRAIEAAMLPRLRTVVATSEPVADRLATEFGVAATVVSAGARDLPRSGPGAADGPSAILAVGVLTPRKGHDRLLRTLARLIDLEWSLDIAGETARAPGYAGDLEALIAELGLRDRVTLHADPDAATLDRLWRAADVFASMTSWEGYPAATAEAIRRGVPAVVTEASGAARIAPAAALVVVPTEDEATFGKCMRRLLFDHALRRDMAESAWDAGRGLPGWPQQAQAFITRLES